MNYGIHYMRRADGTIRATEDFDEYVKWHESADFETTRRIGRTKVNEYEVSTVFLSIDHQWGNGPPILFETMVFDTTTGEGLGTDLFCARYFTEDAARSGHNRVVAALIADEDLDGLSVDP